MMVSEGPVYLILLTPPGRGAIATLRVQGPGAIEHLRHLVCRPSGQPVEEFPTDRPLLVRFGPEPAEEVVLRCFGPEAVEIHCHGGQAAVGRIQNLLAQSGCQVLDWKSWLAAQPGDPIAKEALLCLPDALSERTAGILLDQLHGTLSAEIRKILEILESKPPCSSTGVPGHPNQQFPEMDIFHPEAVSAPLQTSAALERLSTLLSRAAIGRHLTTPWQVVLVGRPNVGKSSLLNALLGYSRAIVHPQPGTTRDVVTATTALDGWPVQLVDTAGWRDSTDPVEEAGIQLARQQAQQADLVLVVTDLSQPWTEADAAFYRAFPNGLWVHNKCDLVSSPPSTEAPALDAPESESGSEASGRSGWRLPSPGPFGTPEPERGAPTSIDSRGYQEESGAGHWEETFAGHGTRPPGLWVSARTGHGLPELIQKIVRGLVPEPPPPGAAVPFTDRQIQLLQAAQHALRRNDPAAAQDALQAILSGSTPLPRETLALP